MIKNATDRKQNPQDWIEAQDRVWNEVLKAIMEPQNWAERGARAELLAQERDNDEAQNWRGE